MDGEYLNATTLATEFITSLNKLPRAASLTLEYKDVIQNLKDVYNDMTSYQRGYLGEENISKYKEYVERMDQILAAAKKAEEKKDQDGSDADSIKAGTTDGDGDSQ
jgi:flagellar basal-body rod modification protein FlgD